MFEDHYVLVFDLTPKQDATEKCYNAELVRQPLKVELNLSFPQELFTELI